MWSNRCVMVLLSLTSANGFMLQPFLPSSITSAGAAGSMSTALQAGQKKKRRRKQLPVSPEPVVNKYPNPSIQELQTETIEEGGLTQADINIMKDVASFVFKPDDAMSMGLGDVKQSDSEGDAEFKLPDIKDARRKKEIEEELARIAEEELAAKPKVKRGDAQAMRKLIESNPFADADDSFFEETEYNVVSALLGERAAPFLGIPNGPIQVGHFIGSLGIILMAFVEYPGFPLTNLPTPVRESFQGGLATVYLINTILAVLSVFKASERGQPVAVWIAKTFAVGGLAYDQLTQLPTLEEIEKAKSTKGKRAPKKDPQYLSTENSLL